MAVKAKEAEAVANRAIFTALAIRLLLIVIRTLSLLIVLNFPKNLRGDQGQKTHKLAKFIQLLCKCEDRIRYFDDGH
ncbi:hypothetical protein GCM10011356_00400 [Kangiella profundi]|nr:hypothetical protein GCM10011356_00400 [Kangiella profundi]